MVVIAGTSRGIFRIEHGVATEVLAERGVRELVRVGDQLFAGGSGGLFRSADDGHTWEPAGISGRTVWQLRASADGTVLYAACEPASLFRSEDSGRSWQEVESLTRVPDAARWCVPLNPPLPGRARALVVDAQTPQRLWVGVEVGGIVRSSDGGHSWHVDLPGANPDIHMLCAHPQNANVLFATTGYGRFDGAAPMEEGNAGVFRSDDGGVTWQYVWRGITPRYSRPMCIDARPPFALTVASAPTAFSNVREAGGAGAMLFRTEDGGTTWRSLGDAAHSPSAANFHGLAPDPTAAGGVITGTDSGEVWRVSNDGVWTQLVSGLPTVLAVAAA